MRRYILYLRWECLMMKFASTIAVLIALVFPISAMGQGSSSPSSKTTSVAIGTLADTVLGLLATFGDD
jgi:hypothetical protein